MSDMALVRRLCGLPFLKRGMRVQVGGIMGYVTGTDALNIRVRFEGRINSIICHPWWETVYYDPDGNILADFRQRKEAENG